MQNRSLENTKHKNMINQSNKVPDHSFAPGAKSQSHKVTDADQLIPSASQDHSIERGLMKSSPIPLLHNTTTFHRRLFSLLLNISLT